MKYGQLMTNWYHWGCALAECISEGRPYTPCPEQTWESRLLASLTAQGY